MELTKVVFRVFKASRPATETEYASLATELKAIGYNLEVIKRRVNKAKGDV